MEEEDQAKRENVHSRIGHMVMDADWQSLSAFILGRFDVNISPEDIADECIPLLPLWQAVENWSDGSWCMWLKNRIYNAHCLSNGGGCSSYGQLNVLLHISFVGIEETPEQLARLRNERTTAPNLASTSKIFDPSSRKPTPIDGTAARVAPPDNH